jgi:hypothetical protein
VLVRVGKYLEVADLPPHAWKERFAPALGTERDRFLDRIFARTSSTA